MDPVALVSLCALLARAPPGRAPPPGLSCPLVADGTSPVGRQAPTISAAPLRYLIGMADIVRGPDARDGIARVAYAEAGNQGDSGLVGVVYTILNRLDDGRWGASIDAVLNAPHQFEPVMRAGGDWRGLVHVSETRQARIDTIINLVLDGRLPDPTNGARFFQNPQIVAARAAAGQVRASLVNFGGAAPSAIIGAHSFYLESARGSGKGAPGSGRKTQSLSLGRSGVGPIFVRPAEPSAAETLAQQGHADGPGLTPLSAEMRAPVARVGGPKGAMFVLAAAPGRAP